MNMTEIVLSAVNLHYSVHAIKHRSLKALLLRSFSHHQQTMTKVNDVHALKNVSLTIGPGERVGFIGHNGAGKTTLLKVVAGLYPISSGIVKVNGSVRALFDLSLGFEPEATDARIFFIEVSLWG